VSRVRRVADGPAATSEPPDLAGSAHSSRDAAERFLVAGHDDAAATAVLHRTYADQATIWSEWARSQPDYLAPLQHALRHLSTRGLVVEVAAGTGQATAALVESNPTVLATDAVAEMVRQGASLVPAAAWVVADAARLPLRDRCVDVLVCCNAVFAIDEARRVLADDGALLVVSSFGDHTPIRHAPQRLLDLMPGWSMTWARAAHGDWAILQREESQQ